jgi:hypothetical protein
MKRSNVSILAKLLHEVTIALTFENYMYVSHLHIIYTSRMTSASASALSVWATNHGVAAPKVGIGDFVFEDPLSEGEYWLDTIQMRRGLFALEGIR